MVDRSFSQSAIGASVAGDDAELGGGLPTQQTGAQTMTNLISEPVSTGHGQIQVFHGLQRSNLGDERISLGSLDEVEQIVEDCPDATSDSVG